MWTNKEMKKSYDCCVGEGFDTSNMWLSNKQHTHALYAHLGGVWIVGYGRWDSDIVCAGSLIPRLVSGKGKRGGYGKGK